MPDGVLVARVDYGGDDDSALVSALRGQQFLIVSAAVSSPNDVNKFVRAAAKAGVPYILPNWYGTDPAHDPPTEPDFIDRHIGTVISEIKDLGVSSYVLLVCSTWFEWSLGGGPNRYGFDFDNRTVNLYDDGNVALNTTTWPQCGRAIANLLSLKELPEDESDKSPTLSQFRNSPVYISSFLVSQRDMFESVKRVTHTSDADWTITHEPIKQAYKESKEAWEKDRTNLPALGKYLYSRLFFPGGWSAYETTCGLHNDILDLPVEDLDEFTAIAISFAAKRVNY